VTILQRTANVATLRVEEVVAALLISEERLLNPTLEGTENITLDAKSVTISLQRQMKNLNYQIKLEWKNTVDSEPQHQSFNIIAKTLNDFTIRWNAGVDSSNYQVEWQVHEVQ